MAAAVFPIPCSRVLTSMCLPMSLDGPVPRPWPVKSGDSEAAWLWRLSHNKVSWSPLISWDPCSGNPPPCCEETTCNGSACEESGSSSSQQSASITRHMCGGTIRSFPTSCQVSAASSLPRRLGQTILMIPMDSQPTETANIVKMSYGTTYKVVYFLEISEISIVNKM